MSTIETTIKDVLGVLPFTGTDGLDLTSDTRPAARTWLQRQGWKGDVVVNLTMDELRDAYTDSVRHSELANAKGVDATRRDLSEAVAHAESVYSPRNANLLAYLARKGVAPVAKPATPIWTPPAKFDPVASFPPIIPAAKDNKDRLNKTAQLALLLGELAGSASAPLDEARVIELVRAHAPKPEAVTVTHEIKIVTATPAEPRVLPNEPRHEVFPEVLAAVAAGLNVLLVGPAGAGKTHLGQQVAKALETSFRFTGALDSPYKLLGFTDAQGRTVRTPYRESFEHGGVFLFDEIDASAPAALLAFNAGLSNGHQDFPDMCVERHATARFIASANTYGRGQDRVYVGRNQLDAASLDRFAVIPMDYDAKLEAELFGYTSWVGRVQKVRAAVAKLNIRHVVSMRAIEQGTALLAAGMAQPKVEAYALWKGLDAASVAKIEAEAR